ncbi:hypothetical protein [Metallibacterium scheffleri]|uniref:hypothetical protein n=1 Tax=Metallibacterium scheffleri TaxID=993689 RepID=UPI00109F1097|nr:hypothetical protein [Metallibacterium scheffleri]
MSKSQSQNPSTGKIAFFVVLYLIIAFVGIGWMANHDYFVGDQFEQVGVVVQATLGVAAILLVSMLLYRIAKSSDHTFQKQRELAQQQRRDDQIDFIEKHLQEALQPYTRIVNAVRYILIGILAAPARSCDNIQPSDRLDRIDLTFDRIFAGGMQSPIVEAFLAWKSSWPAQALLSGGERKNRADKLHRLCDQLMLVVMRYSEITDAFRQPDIHDEQRVLFFDLLFNAPQNALGRFTQIVGMADTAANTSGDKYVPFKLNELDEILPNLDDIREYIKILLTDFSETGASDISAESFNRYPTYMVLEKSSEKVGRNGRIDWWGAGNIQDGLKLTT